jgi:hypothetical protein
MSAVAARCGMRARSNASSSSPDSTMQIVAPDVIRGVQGATVRVSAIVGPGVTGWLVSAALNF